MARRTVYETFDSNTGFPVGDLHETWDAARAAAAQMGLSARAITIDSGNHFTLVDREPQEMTLETILPDSAA
jgi:hypothetical protein